eukprot:TRINITY_DN2508_c3_g1_i1.p1 TRINITY_DN2508_c3_g1~~TRINITY_DN2508_c3_g1_i1.p1  ORF type:complete len:647 (+),score=108.99 TRINITY_DN2508_c3_g1_i1:35-1975(+)
MDRPTTQSLNDEYEDVLYRRAVPTPLPRSGQPYSHLELGSVLPRLPVLSLNETATRYLQWLEPLIDSEAHRRTAAHVAEFIAPGGEGERLQAELEQLDKEAPCSWLEGWWDTGYLEFRVPTVINVNPFFAFANDPGHPSQVLRAAQLIVASLQFYDAIRYNKIEADKEGDKPLCMTQYGRIFATCRLPVAGRDTVYTFTDSRHIVVARKDQFFKIEVIKPNGKHVEGSALVAAFEEIIRLADRGVGGPGAGVSILTTEQRDTWAIARRQLEEESPVNRASLQEIDKALVVLVLDDARAGTLQEMAPLLLHRDGTSRWFDKLQFIVFEDGNAGANMEHAPLDGHTILQCLTDLTKATFSWKGGFGPQTNAESSHAAVRPLMWEIAPSSPVATAIKTAHANFAALTQRTDVRVLEFVNYGASTIKNWKLSPDGFVQCAYQLAYYRYKGYAASTYESAQTKRFCHGRTETLRSVTNESVAFSKIFTDNSASDADKFESLKKAVTAHGKRGNEAKTGHGVDRHWLGLRSIAAHKQQRYPGYLLPRMFTDPSFSKLSRSVLSTSNCGGTALRLFGFGAVVGEGVGIGYMIHPRSINVCVSSFVGDATPFVTHLLKALLDMQRVANAIVPATTNNNNSNTNTKQQQGQTARL